MGVKGVIVVSYLKLIGSCISKEIKTQLGVPQILSKIKYF